MSSRKPSARKPSARKPSARKPSARKPSAYYRASSVDYLEHFAHLWIGFNAWYRDRQPMGGDRRACLGVAGSRLATRFIAAMDGSNDLDPFIVRELDSLSTYKIGTGTAHIDNSGTKLYLQCRGSNPYIDFLEQAAHSADLVPETHGLAFLNVEDPNGVFRYLYRTYAQHMATAPMMVHRSNARDIVDVHLKSLNISQYGRLLFHDLQPVSPGPRMLFRLDDVFGSNYHSMCSMLAKRGRSAFGRSGKRFRTKSVQGYPVFERYLAILYGFRNLYFHGELDPNEPATQVMAEKAYLSLRHLLGQVV